MAVPLFRAGPRANCWANPLRASGAKKPTALRSDDGRHAKKLGRLGLFVIRRSGLQARFGRPQMCPQSDTGGDG